MRWAGHTVTIIASGPSLTMEDAVCARLNCARVIVINEAWRMCASADVLYAADAAWWVHRRPSFQAFPGDRWTQDHGWDRTSLPFQPPNVAKSKGGMGVTMPDGDGVIVQGGNSTFQALGLAVLWGVRRVVFLGLDMSVAPDGRNHFHGDHPEPLRNRTDHYPGFINGYNKAAKQLAAAGIEAVNASRRTALECFPRMTIEEALV